MLCLEAVQGSEAPLNALPEFAPLKVPEFGHDSIAEISVIGGGVTLWGIDTAEETGPKISLRLDPRAPVIIGRQEGGQIPYMDPAYQSTQIGPDGSRCSRRLGRGGTYP